MCAGDIACTSCLGEHANDINALQVCKTKCRAGNGYELGKHVYKSNPEAFRNAFGAKGVPITASNDIDEQIQALNALSITGKDKTGYLTISDGEHSRSVPFNYMEILKSITY